MVIKASAAAEIRQLIAALGNDNEVAREAAVARLAIIGDRAVDPLVRAYRGAADRATRIGILRALEAGGDARALPLAREAIGEGSDPGVAAAGVLRSLLDSPHSATSASALDVLVAVALDESADRRVRLAAAEALGAIPGVRERVSAAVKGLVGAASPAPGQSTAPERAEIEAVWQDAVEGRLPDHPAALRQALQAHGPTAPLGALQALVDGARACERSVPSSRVRDDWRTLRGALHQALALRGSRVALYDLRESLEDASGPLPPSFLAALHAAGDQSCLGAIAAAHHSARDQRWKAQLRDAFQAIARREHLTRRSAAMKRIASKWQADFQELSGTS